MAASKMRSEFVYRGMLPRNKAIGKTIDMLLQQLAMHDQTVVINLVKQLYSSYKMYDCDEAVWQRIVHVLGNYVEMKLLSKIQKLLIGHVLVDVLVMHFYHCECTIKYYLAQRSIHNRDEVSLLEYKIDETRLDYGRINGHSYAYEIKTEYDNFSRLTRQLAEYSKVFEYVYLVTSAKGVEKIDVLPEHCGIMSYNCIDNQMCFSTVKEATHSPCIDPEMQIRIMNTHELRLALKMVGEKPAKLNRSELVEQLSLYSENIGEIFKNVMKETYHANWSHTQQVFNNISAIDVQEFYKSMMNPQWVYYKCSCIE